jgi:hypothetical protein
MTLWLMALGACGTDDAGSDRVLEAELAPLGALPAVCDAGDDAWVARVMPLVLGRRPHSAAEVHAWSTVARELGRPEVVRLLLRRPEAYTAWNDWFEDDLRVARVGGQEHRTCFARSALGPQEGRLTRFLVEHDPGEPYPGGEFTMADVIADALFADDLSPIYTSYLFARMMKPATLPDIDPWVVEPFQRAAFGNSFLSVYLNRSNSCMPCHNSEYSVAPTTFALPGHVERAVFGEPSGLDDPTRLEALFAVEGVVERPDVAPDGTTTYSGVHPWGMAGACGSFVDPVDWIGKPDWLGQDDRFLVQELGAEGSVWDVEGMLRDGMESIRGGGIRVDDDGAVRGEDAFAWLVALQISDHVWARAAGAPLTIANGFPRNEGQRDLLARLATALTQRWSLQDLLVEAASEPAFNPGTTCGADPYGLPALYDPWTTSEEPERRGNGPADAIHALPPRTVLRSVHEVLGWPAPPEWLHTTDSLALQAGVGVFLEEEQPGFVGSDFQSFIEFESRYGTCTFPGDREVTTDLVDRVIADALRTNATVGETVGTLRDRLLLDSAMSTDEKLVVERLLGGPLDRPASQALDLEEGLRAWCGAVLLSPRYWLVTEVHPGEPMTWGASYDCEVVQKVLVAAGHVAECRGATLSIER